MQQVHTCNFAGLSSHASLSWLRYGVVGLGTLKLGVPASTPFKGQGSVRRAGNPCILGVWLTALGPVLHELTSAEASSKYTQQTLSASSATSYPA